MCCLIEISNVHWKSNCTFLLLSVILFWAQMSLKSASNMWNMWTFGLLAQQSIRSLDWVPRSAETSRWSCWCRCSESGRSTTVCCGCPSTTQPYRYSTGWSPAGEKKHQLLTQLLVFILKCAHIKANLLDICCIFLTARKKNLHWAEHMVSKTKVMRDNSPLTLFFATDWGSLWKKQMPF